MNDPHRSSRAQVWRTGAPDQSSRGTVVFGAPHPVSTWTPRGGFQGGLHRLIRSACHEERRPGLYVFAATAEGQLVGRLWLPATVAPIAGTVGRHELAHLPVSPDAELSLRHFLFVVRLVRGAVRYSALDLETPAGLHTMHGQQPSLETEKPTLLRTAGLCFWCAPTGATSRVPDDPATAWHVFTDTPPPRGPSLFERIVQRPPGARGVLTLELHGRTQSLALDTSTLVHGLILGRDERCDVVVPDGFASRVHAVLAELDERLWLIDTGSSNGTGLQGGPRVNCHALQDGDAFWVGRALLRWRALH